MSPLSRRLLIAAWGIPLLLAAAYFGGWFFRILVALIGILAIHEAYGLLNPDGLKQAVWPFYALAAVVPLWVGPSNHLRLPMLIIAALMVLAFLMLTHDVKPARRAIGAALSLPIYPLIPLLYFVWLREFYGWQAIFFLFTLLWVGDTAAYAGGRLTGRHLLAPKVSPKKTVEGLLWALVFSLLTAWGAHHFWLAERLSLLGALTAGVVVWGFGTAGDLFESILKRGAGVKDSSRLLSEHGGVLDRFDSLLFAVVPLFYLLHWTT